MLLNAVRGCGDRGNYTEIDSDAEVGFYGNNPGLAVLGGVGGFPQPGNWRYRLGFKAFASWTYRCRHNFGGRFSIANASRHFDFEVYGLLQAISWVMIVCSMVIAVEVFVLGLRRCVNNAVYPVGYKVQSMPEHFWLGMSRYILDVICKLLIFIMSIILTHTSYTSWYWFK